MTSKILSRRFCELCLKGLPQTSHKLAARLYSSRKLTNREVSQKRNELFETEKQRQRGFIKRIEKIGVQYNGVPKMEQLVMNKDLSTPYNCAMHLGDVIARRSVVAKVNGVLWDMHLPLKGSCMLDLLHMLDEDATEQNKVFWRTCSFLLGYVLENAFKDSINVELCCFPKPRVESGSFVYDVDLKLPDWKPSSMELNSLSMEALNAITQKWDFERLFIDEKLALEMFEDNRFKVAQIPAIAANSKQGKLSVFRMGQHVDITSGPLIGNTSQIGRFTITKMTDIDTEKYGRLTRVQGIALPSDVEVHNSVYDFLCKASRRQNRDGLHFYRQNDRETVNTQR